MNVVRNTDQIVENMDVHQMNIGALKDGIHHPNMLGLENKHQFMAKDQRRLGNSYIQSVNVCCPKYLLTINLLRDWYIGKAIIQKLRF